MKTSTRLTRRLRRIAFATLCWYGYSTFFSSVSQNSRNSRITSSSSFSRWVVVRSCRRGIAASIRPGGGVRKQAVGQVGDAVLRHLHFLLGLDVVPLALPAVEPLQGQVPVPGVGGLEDDLLHEQEGVLLAP